MPDVRIFEVRLRRALIRYAERCPDDVDAVALAREIVTTSSSAGRAAALPWPFGRSRATNQTGRFHLMAGSFKLAAAAAALAAVGWVVIGGAGPRPAPSQVDAPSPSPISEGGDDWAFFSGTVDWDGVTSFAAGGEFRSEHGLSIETGIGSRGYTMVTDDPRMNGTRTDVLNLYSESANNSQANLGMALVMIENDEGAWTCPMTYIHQVTDRSAAGEIEQWAGWCDGSGAYAGLRAYLAMRQPEDPAAAWSQDVYGIITSGDGPTMPEAAAS